MLRQIFFIIGKEKKFLPMMVILFLVSSFMDILGLSLIAPLILKIFSVTSGTNEEINLYFLQFSSSYLTIEFLSIIIITVFLLKGIITVSTNFIITAFSFRQQRIIREKLFYQFLFVTGSQEADNEKSKFISSVEFLSGQFATLVIQSMLKITSELIIIIAVISFLLFIMGPQLLAAILMFLFIVILYDRILSNRLKSYGTRVNDSTSGLIKAVDQGLIGLKTIRVFGSEPFFYRRLKNFASEYSKFQSIYSLFLIIPKQLIEFLIVSAGILFIYLSLSNGISSEEIVSSLGVLGVASMRLAPSVYALANSLTQFRYGKDVIDKLNKDFKDFNNLEFINESLLTSASTYENKNNRKDFEELILKNINFKYSSSKNISLKNINLVLKKNQFIGIMGPSGSGKSTIVNVLLGFLEGYEGDIYMNGKKISNFRNELWPIVSYVPQSPFTFDGSLENNIAMKDNLNDDEKIRFHEAVNKMGLSGLLNDRNKSETDIGESGSKVSGGQKQRIAIARSFYFNKKLIILDEATSALDGENEANIIRNLIKIKDNISIIMISHKHSAIQYCDYVYEIEDGKLINQGMPKDIFSNKMIKR